MKLSAVMIVKNEAANIEAVLRSLQGFDEIVVVDTGSTDDTREIAAKEKKVKLAQFDWVDDFSKARNYAIAQATGDWIMMIDADHLLKTPARLVRKWAREAHVEGHSVCSITLRHVSGHEHQGAWLFKNDPANFYVGAVHEVLSQAATFSTPIVQQYGHVRKTTDALARNLRILLASDVTLPRTQFYLGRTYFEQKNYDESIQWLTSYLKIATWLPEITEAHLTLAKAFWYTQRGNEARSWCLEAIRCNPDFKEALLLMSEIHFEPWKSRWLRLASAATNEDVLFVRVSG